MNTPFAALYDLLLRHFTGDQLRTLLLSLGRVGVVHAVRWGLGQADLSADLVGALQRRGEADAAFFQALMAAQPGTAEAVRAVAALWIGASEAAKLLAPPAPAPAPPSPAPQERVAPRREATMLVIRHCPAEGPTIFRVQNPNGREGQAATLPDPAGWPVQGGEQGLLPRLRWYEEEYYRAPGEPFAAEAAAVLSALRAWGEACFNALFNSRAAAWYDAPDDLPPRLRVVSEDPAVMSWPWEAVWDPADFAWGLIADLSRFLDSGADPSPPPDRLPRDRINILLVSARPSLRRPDGEPGEDVDYAGVSSALVDALFPEQGALAASVTLLRPPTLERLGELLAEKKDLFHVLHFDGHGVAEAHGGALLFEGADQEQDAVPPERLALLLRQHRVPLVVLTACRSADPGAGQRDPFAAVATGLLRARVRAVVAMSYALHEDGAKAFVPAFYRALLCGEGVLAAARAGRQAMRRQPKRAGRYVAEVQDWLLPVVYENGPPALGPVRADEAPSPPLTLPTAAGRDLFAFRGRGRERLSLERALLARAPVATVIHGPPGAGKSALLRDFLLWQHRTGAPWAPVWVDGREGPEGLLRAVGGLLGQGFALESAHAAAEALRGRSALLVVDDADAFGGGAWLAPALEGLQRGRARALLATETWPGALNREDARPCPIGGLDGDSAVALARDVLTSYGGSAPRVGREFHAFVEATGGLPGLIVALASRAIGRAELAVLTETLRALGPGAGLPAILAAVDARLG